MSGGAAQQYERGWYDDPEGGGLRYWDGTSWTNYRADIRGSLGRFYGWEPLQDKPRFFLMEMWRLALLRERRRLSGHDRLINGLVLGRVAQALIDIGTAVLKEVQANYSLYDPVTREIADWGSEWFQPMMTDFDALQDEHNDESNALSPADAKAVVAEANARWGRIETDVLRRDPAYREISDHRQAHDIVQAVEIGGDDEGDGYRAPTAPAGAGGKICPDCAEEVKAAARKCRFCGYRFDSY